MDQETLASSPSLVKGGQRLNYVLNFNFAKSFRSADSWQSNGRKTQILKNWTLPRLSWTQSQPQVPQLRWGFTWSPGFCSPLLSGKKKPKKSMLSLDRFIFCKGSRKKANPSQLTNVQETSLGLTMRCRGLKLHDDWGPKSPDAWNTCFMELYCHINHFPFFTSKRPFKTLCPSVCPCDTAFLDHTLFGPDVH